ncbi:hypothetical protein [Streptodolium elevatio]|uniref:Uncharacterized protein n=1 Tax=Streptodolium elevatio TaxID=3157996 RepID=A0ABV3DDL6_9ACTN
MTIRTRRSRAAVLAIPVLMLVGILPASSASAEPEDYRGKSYQTSGTPVKGSTVDCKDAPVVTPGQYVDSLPGEKDLYYRVKKAPGQLLQVSTTVVLAHRFTRSSSIEVFAGPMPADTKPEGWLRSFATVVGWANVLSTGARSEVQDPNDDPRPLPPDDMGCIRINNRISAKDDPAFPVELLIGLADGDPAKAAVPQAPQQVRTGADAVGGSSFQNATPIAPGTYRQNLTVGEFPMWRVDVRPGQRLSIKGGVETPGDFPYATTMAFTVATFNEMRKETICATDSSGRIQLFDRLKGRFEVSCGPWEIADPEEIRSNNFEYATPGTYYIQLAVAEPAESAVGRVVPIDMVVGVEGTPRAEPAPVFDFGGASVPPGSGAAQSANGTGNAPTTGGTGGSGAPGNGSQQPGTQGGKGTEGASGTAELPGESTSADGGSDDSSARKLALPIGIVMGVALLGGVGYYGLRRR